MYFFLTQTPLFHGSAEGEIPSMLHCLDAYQREYEKDEYVYHIGDSITHAGLVCSGSVIIEHNDVWGNKNILRHAGKGELFAEAYVAMPNNSITSSVIAAETTQVLFLNLSRLLIPCTHSCYKHSILIQNTLQILAHRNYDLSQKILHTTPKSIRGRLLSYFSDQSSIQGSCDITISFNRQQLADYLSVDRSAMSAELSKMARDGLLTYHKNHFVLLQPSEK